MLSFKNYLAEEKNVHMEHLEDSILNLGVDGTRSAINFLRALRDMLQGSSKSKVNVSVNGTEHLLYLQVLIQATKNSLLLKRVFSIRTLKYIRQQPMSMQTRLVI